MRSLLLCAVAAAANLGRSRIDRFIIYVVRRPTVKSSGKIDVCRLDARGRRARWRIIILLRAAAARGLAISQRSEPRQCVKFSDA